MTKQPVEPAAPEAPKYRPGDRVVGTGFGRRGYPGCIVKPSPQTAIVKWDDREGSERIRLDAIRPETSEDVLARKHRQALETWRKARPTTKHVGVSWQSYSNVEIGAQIFGMLHTPTDMRGAANELQAIAL